MAKTKDIELYGHKFKIGVVNCFDGAWIAGVMISGKYPQDPAIFRRVQDLVLSQCVYIKEVDGGTTPLPLYGDGQFRVPGVDFDTLTIEHLCDEALDFSVGPTLQRYIEKIEKAKAEAEALKNQARLTGLPPSQTV